MSTPSNLFSTVERAISAGVLPAEASAAAREPSSAQPWPVVLLSFFGAQFAVWPLLAFVALAGQGFFIKDAAPYFVGAFIIGGSWALLRGKGQPGFLSHMAFTTLLVGAALLSYGICRDLVDTSAQIKSPLLAAFLVTALLLAIAFALVLRWAQTVMAALAGVVFLVLPVALGFGFGAYTRPVSSFFYFSLLFAAFAWAALVVTEPRWSSKSYARSLAAVAQGWVVAVLWVAIGASGSQFGAGVVTGESAGSTFGTYGLPAYQHALAVLITLGAGGGLLARWAPSLSVVSRSLLVLGFVALAVLAWFVPTSAAVALVLAAALATGRMRVFAAALLALVFFLSGFYYSLAMTLVNKALLVMATGAALLLGTLLISGFAKKNKSIAQKSATPLSTGNIKYAFPLMILGAVMALAAANFSIWQKERVISQGQKVFVALAPRDPRSLMQGDFMALNFGMPREVTDALGGERWWQRESNNTTPLSRRASVVAKLDARGVASVLRVAAKNEVLAAGELLLPVQYKNQGWALVTDAFFFPEGAGKSLEAAKFGELRALGNGQALLVGLADENLQPLAALPDAKPE